MLADFSLDKNTLPILLFMLGVLLLIWSFKRKGKRGSRVKTMTTRDTDVLKAADVRNITQELNALFAELQDTARRMAAQMDNRATRLELLIQEADEKIKRLESLQGRGVPPAAQRVAVPMNSAEPATPPPGADSKYRRIYELADRGHSAREIAQEVSAPSGEVELILNLREKSAVRSA